jgi:predicted unusual protein kinase regulating ubiquinone biosynthesis (AarF/ABC1/UbiB family)
MSEDVEGNGTTPDHDDNRRDFPSSRFQRGRIFAKTGLDVGTGYVKHLLKKTVDSEADTSAITRETADKVFKEFTRLRGTALKLAQAMSIDQSFLPDEITEVMTQAQYSVPPINRAMVRSLIQRELGRPPEALFKSFGPEAIAAASIGQVHRAVLHDGRQAAVKIQYPGVRDSIDSDLALAKVLFRRFVKKGSDIEPYFDEVRKTLLEETDYLHEGEEMERFHARFASDRIVTPRWIRELSTARVLTMTYIEGEHLGPFLARHPSQEEKDHAGQLLWDFFHEQIERNAEIHADTHPGNFLFTPDGRLGVIDFGCVKTFPSSFFQSYLELLPTHLERDEAKILDLYRRLGVILGDPATDPLEKQYLDFSTTYGYAFVEPYRVDVFDFGDPGYQERLRQYTRNVPFSNEPRGDKHFIYSTRVHLGLYHLLMKLGARVRTTRSLDIIMGVVSEKPVAGTATV